MPADERLVGFDVEGVAGMTVLGGADAPQVVTGQEFHHRIGAVLVHPADAPGSNDPITAGGTFQEGRVVARAVGVGGRPSFPWGKACAGRRD